MNIENKMRYKDSINSNEFFKHAFIEFFASFKFEENNIVRGKKIKIFYKTLYLSSRRA